MRVASTHRVTHGVHLLRSTGCCVAAHAGSFRLTSCRDCRVIILRDAAEAAAAAGADATAGDETAEEAKTVEGGARRRKGGEFEAWAVVAEGSKGTSLSLRRHASPQRRDAASESAAAAAAMQDGHASSLGTAADGGEAECAPSHGEEADIASYQVPDALDGDSDGGAVDEGEGDEDGDEQSARTVVTRRAMGSGEFVSFAVKPVVAPEPTASEGVPTSVAV